MLSVEFDLDFPRASNTEPAFGVIKQEPEDFYVEELLAPELLDKGEHVWLWVDKIGQNTEYVAEKIAEFANVKLMDVGYSGLKDRWARTRQWFSVYLGNKPEPDWTLWSCTGVTLLKTGRQLKKLRRGEHSANRFAIRVRQFQPAPDTLRVLSDIRARGFPNYFGPQRFGMQAANLSRGLKFFKGEIKASRSQRAFYLSAARSYLFNLNLARAVSGSSWLSESQGGPLYGDEIPGKTQLQEAERKVLEGHPEFAAAIHKNRLKLERRPYVIVPEDLTWCLEHDQLLLEFTLPSGCFATSLLAEFMVFETALGQA
jgi:tRNA pseudouridine13 synthase